MAEKYDDSKDWCAVCGGNFRGHTRRGPYLHRFVTPSKEREDPNEL